VTTRIDTILTDIMDHFSRCVYAVTPAGDNTATWRRWTAEEDLTEVGDRVRLFEVHLSREEPVAPFGFGASVDHFDAPIHVDICYLKSDMHSAIMARDYEAIKRSIDTSDTSGLTGFDFVQYAGYEIMPSTAEGSKHRYMRIKLMTRIEVARETDAVSSHVSGYGVGYI
jgi:hypothetical protein